MLKISTQIATIDERLWSLYDKIPDENKLKKEKIVSVARDEAKQVKEIMENEDDPRKKYIISYSSQQFNTWRLQSTPKISRSASTMHFNQVSYIFLVLVVKSSQGIKISTVVSHCCWHILRMYSASI